MGGPQDGVGRGGAPVGDLSVGEHEQAFRNRAVLGEVREHATGVGAAPAFWGEVGSEAGIVTRQKAVLAGDPGIPPEHINPLGGNGFAQARQFGDEGREYGGPDGARGIDGDDQGAHAVIERAGAVFANGQAAPAGPLPSGGLPAVVQVLHKVAQRFAPIDAGFSQRADCHQGVPAQPVGQHPPLAQGTVEGAGAFGQFVRADLVGGLPAVLIQGGGHGLVAVNEGTKDLAGIFAAIAPVEQDAGGGLDHRALRVEVDDHLVDDEVGGLVGTHGVFLEQALPHRQLPEQDVDVFMGDHEGGLLVGERFKELAAIYLVPAVGVGGGGAVADSALAADENSGQGAKGLAAHQTQVAACQLLLGGVGGHGAAQNAQAFLMHRSWNCRFLATMAFLALRRMLAANRACTSSFRRAR